MTTYRVVNERYSDTAYTVTVDELRELLITVWDDHETVLVERAGGVYEKGSGELVAELVTE